VQLVWHYFVQAETQAEELGVAAAVVVLEADNESVALATEPEHCADETVD
jgi:hypothetical protein